jgi:small conductance mechanosensitive channel
MKDFLNFEISEMLVLFILLLAFFLFAIMKIVKKYFVERQLSNKHQQYYYLIEICVWILFTIWALKIILEESIIYTAIVLAIYFSIAIWITWFVVKDFIAGLVFKFNDNYQIGQFIEVSEIKGHIKNINYLCLDLVSITDEIIKIPYSKIQGNIHKKTKFDKSTIEHKFNLNISKSFSVEKIKEEIKKVVLLTPGVDQKKEPKFKLLDTTERNNNIEITIYILSNKFITSIEQKIDNFVKNELLSSN